MSLKSILLKAIDAYETLKKSDRTINKSDKTDESYLKELKQKVNAFPDDEYTLDEKTFDTLANELTEFAGKMAQKAKKDTALGIYSYRIIVLFEILDATIMALQVYQSSQEIFDANIEIYLNSFIENATVFINTQFPSSMYQGKAMLESDFQPYDIYYSTIDELFLQIKQLAADTTQEAEAEAFAKLTTEAAREKKWVEELKKETKRLEDGATKKISSIAACRASLAQPDSHLSRTDLMGTIRRAKVSDEVARLDALCASESRTLVKDPKATVKKRKAKSRVHFAETTIQVASPAFFTPVATSTPETTTSTPKKSSYDIAAEQLALIKNFGLPKYDEYWKRMHEIIELDYKLQTAWNAYVKCALNNLPDPTLESLYEAYQIQFQAPLFNLLEQANFMENLRVGKDLYKQALKMSGAMKAQVALMQAECATQLLSVKYARPATKGNEQYDVHRLLNTAIDTKLATTFSTVATILHQTFELVEKGIHADLVQDFGSQILDYQDIIRKDVEKKYAHPQHSGTEKATSPRTNAKK